MVRAWKGGGNSTSDSSRQFPPQGTENAKPGNHPGPEKYDYHTMGVGTRERMARELGPSEGVGGRARHGIWCQTGMQTGGGGAVPQGKEKQRDEWNHPESVGPTRLR